jgi:hypothetical protein
MLAQLGARVGSVACLTADEIRLGPLRKLGISSQAAAVLTRLFETARYSTHPMEQEAEGQFGEALEVVEKGLVARAVPG